MSDQELYITHDTHEADPMQKILHFNAKRQDEPVVLLQLSDTNQLPSRHPAETADPPFSHRRTTVVNTMEGTSSAVGESPIDWYLGLKKPDIRQTLIPDGRAIDEFASHRKSRVYGDPFESVVIETAGEAMTQVTHGVTNKQEENTYKTDKRNKNEIKTDSKRATEKDGNSSKLSSMRISSKTNNDDLIVLDRLEARKESEHDVGKTTEIKTSKMSRQNKDAGQLTNFNKQMTIMPAEVTPTDQETPFHREPPNKASPPHEPSKRKAKGEIKARPSSRVRVLIMVDEWDEEYDSSKSTGQKHKKRRGDPDRSDGHGKRDKSRPKQGKGRGSDGSLLSTDDDDGYRSKRGNKKEGNVPKRGRNDDDNYQRTDTRARRYQGGEDGRGERDKRGRKPDDDRRPPRGRDDGRGPGVGGRRPPRGKDGGREPYICSGANDNDSRMSNLSKYERERDRRTKGKSEKGVGDGVHGPKYRTVYAPETATVMNTRRRYHVQITDHSLKEPWFNARFNIGRDNDVDYNYQGPVKITPYYVKDKFY